MKRINLISILILTFNMVAYSQTKVGGLGSASPGAMLELESTNRGFVPPRIYLTDITMNLNGVVPADGTVLYSTNNTIGIGLWTWYNNRWNRNMEKGNRTTNVRFLGRGPTSSSRIEWQPFFIQQPDFALPMWFESRPQEIVIRTSALYLISVGYRKEAVTTAQLDVYVNGTNIGSVRSRGSGANYMNPTYTYLYYFQVGDILTISGPVGSAVTDLGTTQLAISQIPYSQY